MYKILLTRLKQGHRTIRFPDAPPPALPDRFRGCPVVDAVRCADGCHACVDACPTGALVRDAALSVDLGRCLFCMACREACPQGALGHAADYRLAVRDRADLVVDTATATVRLAAALEKKTRRLFGRSFRLRQVSAGGCNACEADTNVLCTIGWDLGRFGIQFTASPRHADGLLVTGPVTANMELALKKTWDAVPDPKVLIAVGACALSGGPWHGLPATRGLAETLREPDLCVPGCPPHPLTILDGLLRLLGRLE